MYFVHCVYSIIVIKYVAVFLICPCRIYMYFLEKITTLQLNVLSTCNLLIRKCVRVELTL